MPSPFLIRAAMVAAGAASLAACATPRYAISTGAATPSEGSRARPFIDPNLRGTMKPYQVNGVWYTPHEQPGYDETGLASWYGDQFNGQPTATGEIYDMTGVSAAHKTLPVPCLVEVTNLDNGRKLLVRVNDRGPFVEGRIIDLSRGAADQLGFRDRGLARVRVRYVGPADGPVAPTQVADAGDRAFAPPPTSLASSGSDAGASISSTALPPPVAAARPPASPPASPPPSLPASLQAPQPGQPLQPAYGASAGWRVQAGAFSNRANAERVAGRFGNAHVEPMDRGGATLWRVILGPADSVQGAEALRDQAAAAGFADATVLGPM